MPATALASPTKLPADSANVTRRSERALSPAPQPQGALAHRGRGKICPDCQTEVFRRGPAGRCAACRRKYRQSPEFLAAERLKRAAKKAEYSQRPEVKERRAAQMRDYSRRPDLRQKHLIRRVTRHAIKQGRLQRMPCEVCGKIRVEAHHDDYSKPLAVRWLCTRHHREIHLVRGDS